MIIIIITLIDTIHVIYNCAVSQLIFSFITWNGEKTTKSLQIATKFDRDKSPHFDVFINKFTGSWSIFSDLMAFFICIQCLSLFLSLPCFGYTIFISKRTQEIVKYNQSIVELVTWSLFAHFKAQPFTQALLKPNRMKNEYISIRNLYVDFFFFSGCVARNSTKVRKKCAFVPTCSQTKQTTAVFSTQHSKFLCSCSKTDFLLASMFVFVFFENFRHENIKSVVACKQEQQTEEKEWDRMCLWFFIFSWDETMNGF